MDIVFCGHYSPSPGGSGGKESACNVGDLGWIPGSGRSPGERNGYSLQYFCLEKSMARGTWWATVRGFTRSFTFIHPTTLYLLIWNVEIIVALVLLGDWKNEGSCMCKILNTAPSKLFPHSLIHT